MLIGSRRAQAREQVAEKIGPNQSARWKHTAGPRGDVASHFVGLLAL